MKILIRTIFLLFVFIGWSQNPHSIRYSIEEGLPTSNIYHVFEDDKGYLWFASDVGVLRYDGYEFQHYNTDNGLGDNEIFKIRQDSKGRIWFLSLNGKLSYYEDQKFYNGNNTKILSSISHPGIAIDLYEDPEANLTFLFIDGHISRLTSDNQTSTANYPYSNRVFSIWKQDGKTFVLGGDQIGTVDGEVHILMSENIYTDAAYRYAMGDQGEYFFSIDNKIYRFTPNLRYELFLELPSSEIIFFSLIDDMIWVGTRDGVFIVNGDDIQHYYKGDQVSGVLKDSQGNYWLSTLTSGIKYIPDLQLKSYNIEESKLKIYSTKADNENRLWIGTVNGLFYKDVQSDSIERYTKRFLNDSDVKVKKLRMIDSSMVAISRKITRLNEGPTGTLVFSTNDILKSDQYFFFAGSNHTGNIEIEKFDRLHKINKQGLAKIIADNLLLEKRSNVLAQSSTKVYIGTSTGLYAFKDDTIHRIESPNEELNTSILDLFFDAQSNVLYVATNSKGLIAMKNDEIIHQVNSINGLNSNGCYAIEKYRDDAYFIGTNKGINLVDFSGDSLVISDHNDLLQIKKEKVNTIELQGETLYFGTDTELLSFEPGKLELSNSRPRLQIDDILVNGELNADISGLKYFMNDVAVTYTGISFSDYGQLEYEYKLNEETNWTSTSARQIEFKNLPHGKYDLSVRAKGRNGLFSETQNVTFEIKPPFWKTFPFIILLILLGLVILYLLIRNIIKSINIKFDRERRELKTEQERALLEKRTIELEQKALRLQMNPHFIFNTLNTIKGYYSGGDIKEANLYISRFSKLLRMILENDDSLVSLDQEIEMLELYIKLIQLRYEDVFDYEIDIASDLNREETGIPPLLLQPLVENAIIHGLAPKDSKGKLAVSFSKKGDKLQCTVRDDGVGFVSSSEQKRNGYQSKALKITMDRVKFVNNSTADHNFEIQSLGNPGGTEVTLQIPLLKLW